MPRFTCLHDKRQLLGEMPLQCAWLLVRSALRPAGEPHRQRTGTVRNEGGSGYVRASHAQSSAGLRLWMALVTASLPCRVREKPAFRATLEQRARATPMGFQERRAGSGWGLLTVGVATRGWICVLLRVQQAIAGTNVRARCRPCTIFRKFSLIADVCGPGSR